MWEIFVDLTCINQTLVFPKCKIWSLGGSVIIDWSLGGSVIIDWSLGGSVIIDWSLGESVIID